MYFKNFIQALIVAPIALFIILVINLFGANLFDGIFSFSGIIMALIVVFMEINACKLG